MNGRIKDVVDLIFSYLVIVPVFWLLIQYSAICERIKESYYRAFNIPYYKGNGKFHPYVKRTDR